MSATPEALRADTGDASPVRLTYISWAESCSRSDHTARELGGRSHMVYAGRYGSQASTILLKYAAQWRETQRILRAERPEVVAVMTPPLVAPLAALWYLWWQGGRLVMDAHSAAFLHPRWRRFLWLQRWLCRRAATTLVHNEHIAALVREAGGHATLVPDVPIVFREIEPFARRTAFTVAVVCSFNYDEPLPAIFEAARLTPDVDYLVTGNPKHLPAHLAASLPPNVTLTGFLSTASYAGLLTGADAVLTLTTRDHTMLRGAYEAIYQGTPVIVSNWALLRAEFPEGASHVDNTPAQIAAAVVEHQQRPAEYRAGAARLCATKLQRWTGTLSEIRRRLAPDVSAPSTARPTAR